MKFWVGVTHKNWFDYLSSIRPDEVNFWRPKGFGFSAIEIGSPFLFKLHSPINKIVGGGFFLRAEKLPLSLAWDSFQSKNGAETLIELRDAIKKYRNSSELNPTIGCIILNQPFFFKEEDWVDVPRDWSPNIVVGKTYDTNSTIGSQLWNEIRIRMYNDENLGIIAEQKELYGREYLSQSRLGQGAFRILVTAAYNRKCAMSGEKALPVLQAAHIKPYSKAGPNNIDNGLLLRSDLHILFDGGYMTINPDYFIEVSNKIKEEFDNGKNYYAFHGKKLMALPELVEERPSRSFIEYHNENIFLG